MTSDKKDKCATVMCAPIEDTAAEYVDMTVGDLRKALGENLEIPNGSVASVSKDKGETFEPVNEDYVLKENEMLSFNRGSATKGPLERVLEFVMNVFRLRSSC